MTFQLARAQGLMRACRLVYSDDPENDPRPWVRADLAAIRLYGRELLPGSIVTFSSRARPIADTEGFVARNDRGDVLVVFRGSEDPGTQGSLVDWISSNALAFKLPYPLPLNPLRFQGQRTVANIVAHVARQRPIIPSRAVHAGFLIAYMAALRVVRREVRAAVNSAPRGRRIVVTGHSLGGAVAVHAAVDLAREFRNLPVHCYTFGAPRTGNSAWELYANRMIADFYHVIQHGDPVPFVPPLGPKRGLPARRYNREAETWYIDRRDRLRPNVPFGANNSALNFSNHVPNSYIEALEDPALRLDRNPRGTRMR